MKSALTLVILIFFSATSHAADNYLMGARATGMAQAAVTLGDVWSSSHNQAGLASLENISAGAFFENRFTVSEFSVKGFAFALPVKNSGVFAISGTHFGYSLYNEKKAGLAFARKLGNKISAGIQIDYLSTYIADDYGTRNTFTVEGGILAEPIKSLRIGIHVFNPTRAKLAEYADEHMPVLFRAGAGYSFSEKVMLCAEVEKDIDFRATFRSGIEYHPMDVLYIRGGIATNPLLSSFGFGLKLKSFKVDFASSYHEVLGLSPQISLTCDFRKP